VWKPCVLPAAYLLNLNVIAAIHKSVKYGKLDENLVNEGILTYD
jgi:hypothetical protein